MPLFTEETERRLKMQNKKKEILDTIDNMSDELVRCLEENAKLKDQNRDYEIALAKLAKKLEDQKVRRN